MSDQKFNFDKDKAFIVNSDGTVTPTDINAAWPDGKTVVFLDHAKFDPDKLRIVCAKDGIEQAEAEKLWELVAEAANYLFEANKGRKNAAEVKLVDWKDPSIGEAKMLVVPKGAITSESQSKSSEEVRTWIKAHIKAAPPVQPAGDNNGGSQPTKTTPPDKGKSGPTTYLEATAGMERGTKEYEAALAKWAASQF